MNATSFGGRPNFLGTVLGLVLIARATFAGARYLWSDWTLFAIAVTAIAFFGGVSVLPGNGTVAQVIGIGVLVGIFAAFVEFVGFAM